MKHSLLAAAIAALLLAGCNRRAETEAPVAGAEPVPARQEQVATPAAPDEVAGPIAGATDAIAEIDHAPSVGDAAFDAKAFSGTFSGTLPCADCPGIDETLELGADGSFTLTDVYRERPQGTATLQGTWSSDADGKRIRLDPGSKTEVDRLFAIEDNDTLVPLGADGERVAGAPDMRLKRGK